MEIKKILLQKFFKVLYSMIKKFDSKLIFIFFSDEFTSLDEMSDNQYSSRFQYSIEFTKEIIYIFDMFEDKKACCKIKRFVIEGEGIFQITYYFLYIFSSGVFF